MVSLTFISPALSTGYRICFLSFHTSVPSIPQMLLVPSYHGSLVYIASSTCNFLCTFHLPLLQYTTLYSLDIGYAMSFSGRFFSELERLCSLRTSPLYHLYYTVILIIFYKCAISIHISPQIDDELHLGLDSICPCF